MDLLYITKDLPGIGGKLRKTPNHFVVEEIPLYKPLGEGQHLYVNLTKTNLTTKEIQNQLANIFNLKTSDVGFAGMKDKNACATQIFSINIGNLDSNFVESSIERINKCMPVIVNWAKLHRNKLKIGHLLGNKFTIIITEVELSNEETLSRAGAIITRLRDKGVPNFFGPQRLGYTGDNFRRGLEIIKGKRYVYDRWLRQFLISSFQSYLCNYYLARRIELELFDHLLKGDIAKKYSTGGLFTVEDAAKEQSRYETHEISFTAPIFGYEMWEATGPAGEFENKILSENEVTLDQLKQAKIKGTRRLGRLIIPDLRMDLSPKGLKLEFTLPKGGFATTILREIMKVEFPSIN